MSNKGNLVVAGGNIGKAAADIYGAFIKKVDKGGKIIIIVVSSEIPLESFESTKNAMELCGAEKGKIECLPLSNIAHLVSQGWSTSGDDEKLLKYFDGVKGVWFVGGDQIKTTTALLRAYKSDTLVLKKIKEIFNGGGVVGGTSAGTSIMGKYMIGAGNDEGALNMPVEYNVTKYEAENREQTGQMLLTRGMGLFDKGILDQHFNKRARLQRLFTALDATGAARGFGISEDTAIVYDATTKKMKVIGTCYVCVVSNTKQGRKLNYYYNGEEIK